jgi:hypothetical protein
MIYVSGGLIRFVKLNTGEGERERELFLWPCHSS